MSLIDDGTYFLLARPAAAGTAGIRIAFYQRTRWKSPPSDQDGKRDWWHRFRKPPYSWTHLKPQNRLLIKRPSRRRCRAKRNYVRATTVYEVYLISERPRLFFIVLAAKKNETNKKRTSYFYRRLRRIVNSTPEETRSFSYERAFPRGNRRCLLVSLRYNVAFANFNEPEWLAAADSTFLRFSLRGVQKSRRAGKFLATDAVWELTDCRHLVYADI